MKTLFVGPYPPPHGGISVHVWSAHKLMKRTGQQSSVLNIDPRAPESDAYIKISGAMSLSRELFRHVSDDWLLNVHTNGENAKSWFIALACGLAAQAGPGASLTLHSGGVPGYLRQNTGWRRHLARFASLLYDRVVCVSEELAAAVAESVVVAVAVGFLNDDFVLEAGKVGRNVEHRVGVAVCHAGGGANGKRSGGAGGHESGFAFETLGEISAGGLLEFVEVDRLLRSEGNGRLDFLRHGGSGEDGVGAGGVNERSDSEFGVVVDGFGRWRSRCIGVSDR